MVFPSQFSIAICAHNSVGRIGRVLDSLTRLQYAGRWEVLVVDNASTDDVAGHVECWQTRLPELRIVGEPVPGLANARLRAIAEARFANVCFVDDDNLPREDYLEVANRVLLDHPDVGIVVARTILHRLADPPSWFDDAASCYAVGPQSDRDGVLPGTAHSWGAGCVLRRGAAQDILERGFRFRLTGRVGDRTLAGEDTEMTLALNIAGWRTYYSADLVVQHAIEPSRMTLDYLQRACMGFGMSAPILGAYEAAIQRGWKGFIKSHDMTAALLAFRRYILASVSRLVRPGIRSDIRHWQSIGELKALLVSELRPSAVRRSEFLAGHSHPRDPSGSSRNTARG